MQFICLGYADPARFAAMSEGELAELLETCFAYDDELRQAGHYVGGLALQAADQAVTLRCRAGQTEVTDGPYAETREQIGGILLLEARDLEHAIELMSKHPGVAVGPFEIRPADAAINSMIAARFQSTE